MRHMKNNREQGFVDHPKGYLRSHPKQATFESPRSPWKIEPGMLFVSVHRSELALYAYGRESWEGFFRSIVETVLPCTLCMYPRIPVRHMEDQGHRQQNHKMLCVLLVTCVFGPCGSRAFVKEQVGRGSAAEIAYVLVRSSSRKQAWVDEKKFRPSFVHLRRHCTRNSSARDW